MLRLFTEHEGKNNTPIANRESIAPFSEYTSILQSIGKNATNRDSACVVVLIYNSQMLRNKLF